MYIGKAYIINLGSNIKKMKHQGTIISCVTVISFQGKHRNLRFICNTHWAGRYIFRGTTYLRSIQKYTSYKIILGIIPHRRLKASGGNSKKNIIERRDR